MASKGEVEQKGKGKQGGKPNQSGHSSPASGPAAVDASKGHSKSSDPTKGKTKANPRNPSPGPGKGDKLKGKGKTVPQPGAPSNGDKGAPSKGKAKTAKQPASPAKGKGKTTDQAPSPEHTQPHTGGSPAKGKAKTAQQPSSPAKGKGKTVDQATMTPPSGKGKCKSKSPAASGPSAPAAVSPSAGAVMQLERGLHPVPQPVTPHHEKQEKGTTTSKGKGKNESAVLKGSMKGNATDELQSPPAKCVREAKPGDTTPSTKEAPVRGLRASSRWPGQLPPRRTRAKDMATPRVSNVRLHLIPWTRWITMCGEGVPLGLPQEPFSATTLHTRISFSSLIIATLHHCRRQHLHVTILEARATGDS